MIQFYSPDIVSSLKLGVEETVHCVRVLRKKPGDTITVTDGMGHRYECTIVGEDRKELHLQIKSEESVAPTWNYRLTIAVAPTKNADRMSWLVEKAVEVGVDEICFIHCRNGERRTINIDRMRRHAISAMNQSLKTRLPEITESDIASLVERKESGRYFGYCDASHARLPFTEACNVADDILIAIGPEGDFSPEEVKKLSEAGFQAVTFGDERLRTETAALYATVATHILNDLKK